MKRLSRLDVSIDMAVDLLLVWLLCKGCLLVAFASGLLGCASTPLLYVIDVSDRFTTGMLGWGLGLVVLGVAYLETRVRLRPWFKRVLRLSGAFFLATLLLPVLMQYSAFEH